MVAAKPAKAKPVSVAKPKPAPSKPNPSTPVSPVISPSAPGDWTTDRADSAGTGDNPYETAITAANVQNLHEVWTAPSGVGNGFPMSPLVAGGLVFDTEFVPATEYSSNSVLSAFDLGSGAVRWQRTLAGGQQVIGAIDGLVIVTNPDFGRGSTVQAFDQKTGAPRWTWQAPVGGQITGQVLAASEHLFVPVAGGLYALDPNNGHELFVITCTEQDTNCPFNLTAGVASNRSEIFAGGFEEDAGFEFAAADGKRFNALSAPNTQSELIGPVISGSQVFVSGEHMGPQSHQVGEVASFSTSPCGTPFCTSQWKVDVPGGAGQLAIADGRLFVLGGGDGNLEALNPANGEVLWKAQASPDENGFLSIAGNVLYVVQGITISAYPAAGCASGTNCQPLWQYIVPDHTLDLHAPVVVTGGRLLYANFAGLHALAVN